MEKIVLSARRRGREQEKGISGLVRFGYCPVPPHAKWSRGCGSAWLASNALEQMEILASLKLVSTHPVLLFCKY